MILHQRVTDFTLDIALNGFGKFGPQISLQIRDLILGGFKKSLNQVVVQHLAWRVIV
jgi:hypothetical protein